MEPRIDEGVEEPYDHRVMEVQEWLNETYKQYMPTRFKRVKENGKTGWDVIYGLRRALQIELDIEETSDSFGPQTYSKCPTIAQGAEGNLVSIVQGGLWCKGYNPGGFNGYYGNGTYSAVKELKADAGFPTSTGNMQKDFMRALLDMSAFTCLSGGTESIRTIQQQLNYDYYDYYQICPCDGLYNRDMNKMLTYALQNELGIAQSSATGTWGPTTISLCQAKTFNVGSSSQIIKLVRYATVCNGFSVSTSSSTYDSTLDAVIKEFCSSLLITKPTNQINYTVIKSLLSSNGDTDRAALGCDTATKLSLAQIQTIKNAGYKYIGRYISNTPGGTLNKALTRSEIENILNAGLKVIYIFQESNNSPSNFYRTKGERQALKAIFSMNSLGAPSKSTIYFAVDCDPQDSEISSNIISYFRGIIDTFVEENVDFTIGVYGTRNVCSRLKKTFNTFMHYYVSDASYGFSGNLGYTIPSGWAFDQFKTDITIGSGTATVGIDKVGVSGKDSANYGELRTPNGNYDPENNVTVFKPTTEQKNAQGRLYVNMNDGLRIYSQIKSVDKKDAFIATDEEHAFPRDEDLIYTLPKYAMYVNMGVVQDEKDTTSARPERFHRAAYVIKFLNNAGVIQYGYIAVNKSFPLYDNAGGSITLPVSSEVDKDIQSYEKQQEFTNYIVDSTHTKLVNSSRQSIDNLSCVIYRLKEAVQVYDSLAVYQYSLDADTEIAITSSNTGSTHNELVFVNKFFNKKTNKWENLLDSGGAFITYKLEQGCMPNNRIVNN